MYFGREVISLIVLEERISTFFLPTEKNDEQQPCFILAPKAAQMTNATIFQYVASSRKYFKVWCNCCMWEWTGSPVHLSPVTIILICSEQQGYSHAEITHMLRCSAGSRPNWHPNWQAQLRDWRLNWAWKLKRDVCFCPQRWFVQAVFEMCYQIMCSTFCCSFCCLSFVARERTSAAGKKNNN